ncbi:MAG: rhomboid family intramembrane serine protease [Oscillospiraceae bacterium]|nr:rhomboid family intramembrane serine protease [Oscillospiraceae bacterium]
MLKKFFSKFQYNAPVILTYTLVCAAALLLNMLTNGWANKYLFSAYRTSFLSPMQYPRLITHIIGHGSYEHFLGNFMIILLVGPMLEEKYGSKPMLKMILFTGFVTGLIQVIFFPSIRLLGASGIAFMLILLSSFANFRKGRIPLTLILVALIYLSGEIIAALSPQKDNVSQMAHIIGGLCGTAFGWAVTKPKAEGGSGSPAAPQMTS